MYFRTLIFAGLVLFGFQTGRNVEHQHDRVMRRLEGISDFGIQATGSVMFSIAAVGFRISGNSSAEHNCCCSCVLFTYSSVYIYDRSKLQIYMRWPEEVMACMCFPFLVT